jgi:enoyl-CoA hydratase/carnithine racemase
MLPSIERLNGTLLIRFNEPVIRNPLSAEIVASLLTTIQMEGTTASKVVFTGAQDVFVSGADLRQIRSLTQETARDFAILGQTLMNELEQHKAPTIAAVNGYCFGGGLDLALACKKRIASPNAVFCHPGVSLGIITGWGGTQRLPRLVGQGTALEMLLTASRISAIEALKIGLIDNIAEDPLAAALDTGSNQNL